MKNYKYYHMDKYCMEKSDLFKFTFKGHIKLFLQVFFLYLKFHFLTRWKYCKKNQSCVNCNPTQMYFSKRIIKLEYKRALVYFNLEDPKF